MTSLRGEISELEKQIQIAGQTRQKDGPRWLQGWIRGKFDGKNVVVPCSAVLSRLGEQQVPNRSD